MVKLTFARRLFSVQRFVGRSEEEADQRWSFSQFFRNIANHRQERGREREREREREAYQDTDNDRKLNIIMEVLLRVVDCGPGWLEDGKGTRTMDGSLFYFSSSSACLSNGLSEEWSRIG